MNPSASPLPTADPWDLSAVQQSEIAALTHQPLGWAEFDWVGYFTTHWHNRLVHLPLVLILLAALLSLRSWRGLNPYWQLLRQLWGAAVLLGAGAVLTGQLQFAPFASGQMVLFAFWHRLLGWTAMLLLALGWLWGWRFPAESLQGQRRQSIWLWVGLLLSWLTGLLGGVLAGSGH